jgi:hypothetical protein
MNQRKRDFSVVCTCAYSFVLCCRASAIFRRGGIPFRLKPFSVVPAKKLVKLMPVVNNVITDYMGRIT